MAQREQLIIVIKHKFSLGVILTYWLGYQSKNNLVFFLMEISGSMVGTKAYLIPNTSK